MESFSIELLEDIERMNWANRRSSSMSYYLAIIIAVTLNTDNCVIQTYFFKLFLEFFIKKEGVTPV